MVEEQESLEVTRSPPGAFYRHWARILHAYHSHKKCSMKQKKKKKRGPIICFCWLLNISIAQPLQTTRGFKHAECRNDLRRCEKYLRFLVRSGWGDLHTTAWTKPQEAISTSLTLPSFCSSPSILLLSPPWPPPSKLEATWLLSTSASFLLFHRKHAWIIRPLLLIVKIISKLPGAVYYICIVIFYPKTSNSPASLSALGMSTLQLGGCQRRLQQPHLQGLKGVDPHLQCLRQ